jgi:hypothetical protein
MKLVQIDNLSSRERDQSEFDYKPCCWRTASKVQCVIRMQGMSRSRGLLGFKLGGVRRVSNRANAEKWGYTSYVVGPSELSFYTE